MRLSESVFPVVGHDPDVGMGDFHGLEHTRQILHRPEAFGDPSQARFQTVSQFVVPVR